jgi:histidinol-phosphate/aromatic aminotransferase/cobyric acid decarboxylase-like protein
VELELLGQEKDRFYSRLSMIPGIRPMPSVGNWILLQVARPTEVARRVSRKFDPAIISVPRHVNGAVRITVSDPKTNERLLRTLREAVA